MTNPQIFDIPMHYKHMDHGISLTGVTVLKQNQYKSRHNKIKEAHQIPINHYITTPAYKRLHPDEFKPNKRRKVKPVDNISVVKKLVRKSEYVINKKEVVNRIKQYVLQMKGAKELYFWTVTFPVKTSDDQCHTLFNKWLTRLRTEKMLKEYLWITERQLNGTLHFHMVINRKMDVKKANKFMRASIMYSINNKQVNWTRDAAKNYNGVDIAKNRKTRRVTNFALKKNERNLTSYLTKYISKNDEKFKHLAWHSSREYSNLIISLRLTASEFIVSSLTQYINTEKPLEGEYFTFYRWKAEPPDKVTQYFSNINSHIQTLLS